MSASHDSAATAPLDDATSRRIARAFLPARRFGSRWHYHYSAIKLRSDPLYPGVLAALDGCEAPLLDLGCGLGLLAHALRDAGRTLPYHGVDLDAGKIAIALHAARGAGLADARFSCVDLAEQAVAHAGSVAVLDVLQYLPRAAQRTLLGQAIAMLEPGSRLVIRTGLDDGSHRGRLTRLADRAANLVGWMQSRPRAYPRLDALRATLQGAGLVVTCAPLYGRTPFNNWLVVAQRPG